MKKPPKEGSKLYNEVLEVGCGGYTNEGVGDFDCIYQYDWGCDYCPVFKEKMKNKNDETIEHKLDL